MLKCFFKQKKFLCLVTTLIAVFVASITLSIVCLTKSSVAFAGKESLLSQENVTINYVAGSFTGEGYYDMGSQLCGLSTKEDVEANSIEMVVNFGDATPTEYVGQLYLRDSNHGGKGSWEDSERTGYMIWINNGGKGKLDLQRVSGTSQNNDGMTGVSTKSDLTIYDGNDHTIRIDLINSNDSVNIKVKLDNTLVLDVTDTSDDRVTANGGLTLINNGKLQMIVRSITAIVPETNWLELDVNNIPTKLNLGYNAGSYNGEASGLVMVKALSALSTKTDVNDESFEMKVKFEDTVPQAYAAQLFLRDSNHAGKGSWEDANRTGYLIWFNNGNKGKLDLQRVSGTGQSTDGITGVSSRSDLTIYDGQEHMVRVDMINSNDTVTIKVKLDGVEVLNAIDSNESRITANGGVTFVNSNIDVTINSIRSFTDDTVEVTGVTLNKASLELNIEQTEKLIATVAPNNATVTAVSWSSSDPEIATVDKEGLVKALKAGSCQITVTSESGAKTAVCQLTVKNDEVAVEEVEISKESLRLFEGYSISLRASVLPDYATVKGVSWSSSNVEVATVDNEGVVTAVASGNCEIIATSIGDSSDGVKVTAKALLTVVNDTGIQVVDFTDIIDDYKTFTGTMNEQQYAGEVIFYPNGKKDSVHMQGTQIVTMAKSDVSTSADMIFTTKVKVTWGEKDADWGTFLNFRDTEEGPMWAGTASQKLYGVRFNRETKDSDDGTLVLIKYIGQTATVLDEYAASINGVEFNLRISLINVDKDNDGKVDFVWITVADNNGKVFLEYEDDSETRITENGNFMAIKHYTRTCLLTGTKVGADAESVIIGAYSRVQSIELDKESLTLKVGENESLIATILPNNAENKEIQWQSNNNKVATVDENGKVTAVGAGTCVISAIALDTMEIASCSVTVTADTVDDTNNTDEENSSGCGSNITSTSVVLLGSCLALAYLLKKRKIDN